MKLTHTRLNILLALACLAVLAVQTGSAQVLDLPAGIPPEYGGVVTFLIGLLSAALVGPLTAIWKKLGRTTGVSTVAVSGGLSLLVAFGFSAAQAAATNQGVSLIGVLSIALVAFAKANGDYLMRTFSTGKALQAAPTGMPLFGLPGLGAQGTGLNNPLLESLIKMALTSAGLPAAGQQVVMVAYRLAPLAPDLFDGDPRLSTDNLNALNGVVLDLKRELGGSK